ncbi:hypothetical protein QF031_000705 [Pseudarthrobacter defluvii]|uniref:hypothetical protein n=1 Tax=Pseudarthrobacter defluvii TaxID=410837 RepID=UPI0027877E75|nr:hypothetical protein [Pseudarthrobacter defluvii]MDQ0767956.1 hypothetical protein [Pseudarthrobacter defluvii]
MNHQQSNPDDHRIDANPEEPDPDDFYPELVEADAVDHMAPEEVDPDDVFRND